MFGLKNQKKKTTGQALINREGNYSKSNSKTLIKERFQTRYEVEIVFLLTQLNRSACLIYCDYIDWMSRLIIQQLGGETTGINRSI